MRDPKEAASGTAERREEALQGATTPHAQVGHMAAWRSMGGTDVVTRVLEGDRLKCKITSSEGEELLLTGSRIDVEPPLVWGSEKLRRSRALVDNAWACAKFTSLMVSLPTDEGQQNARKRAKQHKKVVEWLADLADDEVVAVKRAWCSSCFAHVDHEKLKRPAAQLSAYLCTNCGSPTLSCANPKCDHMAVRARGGIRVPQYCAEHDHTITGFEKSRQKMDSLVDYHEYLEFENANMSRASKLVGVSVAGLVLAVPGALVAAPAIGGALGSLIGGYSGAAASSYGLALLGGGAVAQGGLGVAGGTLVVGAVGGALGGAVGASVANAYVREDKSFHIEMLQGGSGVPVVVCNGFLSEGGRGWGDWKRLVAGRYPDSPVYRVHWGAKELRDLGIMGGAGAAQVALPKAVLNAAVVATKEAAVKLGPLGPALLASTLAKNPWHVAKSRADKTGVVVADLLARTKAESYVLIGHSLGARVTAVVAQSLGSKDDGPRVEAVHLTGAAIRARSDWTLLTARVKDCVYNYYSANDNVLKVLYGVAQGGQKAAGLNGFSPVPDRLKNIDVSDQIKAHSDYYTKIDLL